MRGEIGVEEETSWDAEGAVDVVAVAVAGVVTVVVFFVFVFVLGCMLLSSLLGIRKRTLAALGLDLDAARAMR